MFKKIKLRSLLANSWVLLFLAVLIAGGLTFFLYKYLNDREAKLKQDLASHRVRAGVVVIVPSRDVPVGTPLSSSDFVMREIAGDMAYDDMIREENFAQYRDSHLVKPVRRGLPLRASDIDALRGRDFSDVLKLGTRAVTVDIDTVNSTALMLRPGNHVDIYRVGRQVQESGGGEDTKVAQLLLPDVLILATGQDMRPRNAGEAAQFDQANANSSAMSRQQGEGYTTVTLEIPVDDTARIALAQKIGGLRLILRNSDDKGANGPALVQENEVFTAQPGNPGRRRMNGEGGPATRAVEIISGGGGSNTSLLVPQPAPSAPVQDVSSQSPIATSGPAMPPSRQPSVYEQANAIAQQLQKATAPVTPKQN